MKFVMKSIWVNTLAWLLAALVALGLALAFPSESSVMGRLPALQAKRLDQQPLHLPMGLPSDRTLAIVTFDRTQRTASESWIAGMQLQGHPTIAWLRLAVIHDTGDVTRRDSAENRLMLRYTRAEERASLVPVFTDRDAFVRAAGLTGIDRPWVLVLNRRGEVLARVPGAFDPDKAATLRETLLDKSPA